MRACAFAAEISCPGRAKLAAHGGTDSLVRPPHGSLVRAELSSRPTLALPRHLISPPLSRPPRLPRKKLPGDRRGRVSPARPAAPSAERPHASKAKRPCSAFTAPSSTSNAERPCSAFAARRRRRAARAAPSDPSQVPRHAARPKPPLLLALLGEVEESEPPCATRALDDPGYSEPCLAPPGHLRPRHVKYSS